MTTTIVRLHVVEGATLGVALGRKPLDVTVGNSWALLYRVLSRWPTYCIHMVHFSDVSVFYLRVGLSSHQIFIFIMQ